MGCAVLQGRIYAANEYPTFVRTTLIVCQKLKILRQSMSLEDKICLF